MNRTVGRVVVALLLGVLVYGAFVLWAGYQRLADSLAHFDGRMFLAALGLASANYVLRFLKWEFYLARLGIRGVPKLDSFLIFLSGFVLTITPGKVGEVFKSAVLARTYGVPIERTAPIVLAERLTDVIGVVLLILVGSTSFGVGWPLYGGVALIAVALTFVLWEAPTQLVFARLERGPARLAALVPKFRESYVALRLCCATPVALLYPTLLSLLGWGLEGWSLYLLLQGFSAPAPLTAAVFFYATATLAGALVPVPGGLGVAELVLREGLIRFAAVADGPATAAMLLLRFATLWWAVVVGFAALGILRLRFPQLADEAKAS